MERLDKLIASALPGLAYQARFAFTAGSESEKDVNIKRLEGMLLTQAQDADVRAHRVLPAEVSRFQRRYGADGTAADWASWVKDAPPVPARFRRDATPTIGRSYDSGDALPVDSTPDTTLVARAKAKMKLDRTLTFSRASIEAMEEDPQLAEAYRSQPGVKDY